MKKLINKIKWDQKLWHEKKLNKIQWNEKKKNINKNLKK